jgi:flagellar FliJ protein
VRFVFRLETPLRLARHAEDRARRELGFAVAALESRKQELQSLRDELESETRAQEAPRSGEIWIQGQNLFLDWTRGQRDRIRQGHREVEEAEAAVARARAVLVEKKRGVEVLERLRERRYAQWKLERSRKELAEGSDVAGRRWMAQRREA